MMRNHDLFDRFRREAEDLSERPSAQAWRNIESRLDAHRRRHRVSLYRSLGMVAAVLALVVMLTLLALTPDRLEDKQELVHNYDHHPKHLQDLYVGEEDARAIRVLEIKRSYENHPSKRIEEGDPAKKLMPSRQGRQL